MGNKRMKDLTGAEIIIHEKDANALVHQPPSMLEMFHAEPSPPADITVKDGDLITIGETSLKVIHTPGTYLRENGPVCGSPSMVSSDSYEITILHCNVGRRRGFSMKHFQH